MRPLVNLQVLAPGEHLPTTRKRARKRLFPRVHPNMIHQLVLRLEGPAVPRTVLPETGVCRALRSTHMFHSQMRHNLVHTREVLPAGLPGRLLLGVYPQTLHLLLDGLPHVPEEGPVDVAGMMGHPPEVGVQILMVVVRLGMVRRVVVRPGVEHLVVRRQVRIVMRRHLGMMVEQHGITGRGLSRRKLVVLATQQKVSGRVTGMGIQVPHVAVVGLEVVLAGRHLRGGHGRRGVLVRRQGGASVVARRHLDAVARQVVVARVHEGVDHGDSRVTHSRFGGSPLIWGPGRRLEVPVVTAGLRTPAGLSGDGGRRRGAGASHWKRPGPQPLGAGVRNALWRTPLVGGGPMWREGVTWLKRVYLLIADFYRDCLFLSGVNTSSAINRLTDGWLCLSEVFVAA